MNPPPKKNKEKFLNRAISSYSFACWTDVNLKTSVLYILHFIPRKNEPSPPSKKNKEKFLDRAISSYSFVCWTHVNWETSVLYILHFIPRKNKR